MANESGFIEIGERIIAKRREKGLTQSQLAKEGGFDIATINQIEQGKVRPSEKYFRRLAVILEVSVDYLKFGIERHIVGFVFGHMYVPLLQIIEERIIPKGLLLTYFYKEDSMELALCTNEDVEQVPRDTSKVRFLSAPLLFEGLASDTIDMVFVPTSTYRYNSKLVRLCSIMNTAKGGLGALVCRKKKWPDNTNQTLSELLKSSSINATFLKNSVSENFFNEVILGYGFKDCKPTTVLFDQTMSKLVESFSDNLLNKLVNNEAEVSMFIGWEPYISMVKSRIANANEIHYHTLDQSAFIQEGEPNYHISVDCIVKADRLMEIVNNPFVKIFMQALKESVDKLNEIKKLPQPHYMITGMADNLLMSDSKELHSLLHKINFEFAVYDSKLG